jgi:hypothetical protein
MIWSSKATTISPTSTSTLALVTIRRSYRTKTSSLRSSSKCRMSQAISSRKPDWVRLWRLKSATGASEDRAGINVAFVVLMPSGLEADIASLRDAVDRSENQFDYVDIREDRIIFYGSFWDRYQEVSFKAKAINQGDFVLPPVFGEDMYDHETYFLGEKDRFTVLAP